MAKLNAKKVNEAEESLEELIPKFFELDSAKKEYDKKAVLVKDKVKEKMSNLEMDKIVVGDLTATLSVQDRSSMNPDKLLEKMKALGFTEAIKTKEYVDEEFVEDLIYTNKLKPEQIADCMDTKNVIVFSVRQKKAKKVAK